MQVYLQECRSYYDSKPAEAERTNYFIRCIHWIKKYIFKLIIPSVEESGSKQYLLVEEYIGNTKLSEWQFRVMCQEL